MQNRKASLIAGAALILLGAMFLARAIGNPRVDALHGSDVVALTGCGACLGVGLVGLLGRLRLRSE